MQKGGLVQAGYDTVNEMTGGGPGNAIMRLMGGFGGIGKKVLAAGGTFGEIVNGTNIRDRAKVTSKYGYRSPNDD